jgi:hypothetical protein
MSREGPTAYEFACGACQVRTLAPDFRITLWKEHGTYHVRGHDFSTHTRVFWDSFRTLTEARKRFAEAVREYLA